MASIQEMRPGDYVKVGSNRYKEIVEVHGVASDGSLAKPSEGGFSVTTTSGQTVGMWEGRGYCKRDELPPGAMVD